MTSACIKAGGWEHADMAVSGASHGGLGGNSDCIGDNFKGVETKPSYGNNESPREFGSGGVGNCGAADTSAGGGRVYIEAFEEITINGNIHEDATPCVSTGGDTSAALCGTGSGGSVWIKAPTITGQGSISAQAGNYLIEGGYLWATGSGGRIALHGNTISPLLQQNIDVAVDIESTNYICLNGDSGSVELGCYTTLCHNGGTLSPNGDCSCECPEPDRFGGADCSQCQITHCSHGGELDPIDCKCLCQEGFTGDRCDHCDPDYFCNGAGVCNNVDLSCTCNEGYYGERCDTFCDPIQSCNGLGVCNDDGICECRDGKYGGDCSCDIIQDCQSNPENACRSNGGYCKDDGSCECQPGWTGCHCDIQCSSVLHCSGHGSCNFDGTCHCDKGWEGESCSGQDLDQFCNGIDRISDYPCLKGVVDTLGYGFNAVSGETTRKIVSLTFNPGNTFTLDGTTYIVPDNVSCKPISKSDETISLQSFSKSKDYQRELSASLGLSGEKYRQAYMSASGEYKTAIDQSFKENRKLFRSYFDHGLYKCEIIHVGLDIPLSEVAQNAMNDYSGDRRIKALGTHVVSKATFGGRVSVLNFVNSCVFEQSSEQTIGVELEGIFYNQAGSASTSGDVQSVVDDECSIVAANSRYSKTISGGEREVLFVTEDATETVFSTWIDSVEHNPADIGFELDSLTYVIPETDIELDLEEYLSVNENDDGGYDSTDGKGACYDIPSGCKGEDDDDDDCEPNKTKWGSLCLSNGAKYGLIAAGCIISLVCLCICCAVCCGGG